MNDEILLSLQKLENYCSLEGWKGWDPYDGLNSKVFKALPIINKSTLVKMAWIQFFKHNPVNLRPLMLVPKGFNAKGTGLFLSGYCNIYNAQTVAGHEFIAGQEKLAQKIIFLADMLCAFKSAGYSGACWGYNFDWQSRAFFLPCNTPTVVVTSFVVEALLKAHEISKSDKYLEIALSSAEFIRNDLNRIEKQRGYMFSYSPLDHRAVYNASLLGTKTLSLIYHYTGNEEYRQMARDTAQAVCDVQHEDGSFPHSDQVGNQWRDSFHTGFKLESLACFQRYCADESCKANIEKGFTYWLEHFFDQETGVALYYENNRDLIDLHCAAQSVPTFYSLGEFNARQQLITRIMLWAVHHMQDKRGYFYFQKRKNHMIKIPYMRWPNAWMFYGMSYYLTGFVNYGKDQGIHQTHSDRN
jgi:hypothetical protein